MSGNGNSGRRGFAIILFLTILLVSSIALGSAATDSSTSIGANCYECHEPSIYLMVEIRFIDAPSLMVRNESTPVNVTIEVSGSHKSYVWSGFGMDVWLASGTDHTSCGPHQIINGQKPHGQTSPYTWTQTFSFLINSSLIGEETISVNAKMSPIHESPPVTARETITIPVVASKDHAVITDDDDFPDSDKVQQPEDGDDPKLGPAGLSIVIIGGLAVIAGLLYAGYSLLAPVGREVEKGRHRRIR